jgi:glycosyltransferase involved in cell wall biosynthesis
VRIGIALPGLHRVNRGAELAFEQVGQGLALLGNDVTLIGTGEQREGSSYSFVKTSSDRRERFERWPKLPVLHSEFIYEELTWIPSLARHYRPDDFDVTMTCSYPFTNWLLRGRHRKRRPAHIFVTQNGDAPAILDCHEYRFFGCDGLVCTNPEYYERNRSGWQTTLIPNGVDSSSYQPGPSEREQLGLPADVPILLMVSALTAQKRVLEAIQVVAKVPDVFFLIAGDGALRDKADQLAAKLLPSRFRRLTLPADRMPALYRSADALLHMTYAEPFGNVYIEAMASGLPVIAHESEATRWIVANDGILVDTDDFDLTARAVTTTLLQGKDHAIGAARSTAHRFGWDTIAQQYHDFFGEVLACRRDAKIR